MTAEKVALGEKLYFDKRLSASGSVSCALCHDPASAFTNQDAISGAQGTRNAPTILNAMFSERLFWDGRTGSLEEQAKSRRLPIRRRWEWAVTIWWWRAFRNPGIPEGISTRLRQGRHHD